VLPLSLGNDTAPRVSATSGASSRPPSVASASAPVVATTSTTSTSISDPGATAPAVTGPAVTGPAVTGPAVTGPVTNVAIIGDSISQMAAHDLTRTLRHYNVTVDAKGGTTMADHFLTIENLANDGQPRDWVIELGTNDVLARSPNLASDFANEVAVLQGQACVWFVTVNTRLGPVSMDFNDGIANAVASHANFHMLDWGSIEFHNSQWLQSDGLHPSKYGDAELAKLEHKAIIGCQGR